MRVLIADERACVRDLLSRYVQSLGHDCAVAPDGRTVLTLTRQFAFDVLLANSLLPGLEGASLVSRIRELPQDQYLYLILYGGRDDTGGLASAIEAGADDFMLSPIDRDFLWMRLRAGERLLGLHRGSQPAHRRLDDELTRARVALDSMLPANHSAGAFDLAWLFQPCDFVGGDLFNAHALDADRVSIYSFDVSGHGVASALLAVMLGNMLRPWPYRGHLGSPLGTLRHDSLHSPTEVAALLNERFPFAPPNDLYFTLFYGVVDQRKGVLDWVRAGHPPAMLVHDRGLDMLEPGDPPVGLFNGQRYTQHCTAIDPGDRLVLYSDGITEAQNDSGEPFGIDRLRGAVEVNRGSSITSLVGQVQRSLVDHRGSAQFDDDVSMLVVEAK